MTRKGKIFFSIDTPSDAETGLMIDGLDKITVEKRGWKESPEKEDEVESIIDADLADEKRLCSASMPVSYDEDLIKLKIFNQTSSTYGSGESDS